MNQGTIWTVVKPTVGLPLLLGSVTVIAILVHLALINNTTWFPKYWNGGATAAVAAPAAPVAPAKK
jgi:light-harvesting protein B-800-850 alpha chain